jgi:hypothetical protein
MNHPRLLVRIPARKCSFFEAMMRELELESQSGALDLLLSWAQTKEGEAWLKEEIARRASEAPAPSAWSK